MDEHKYASYKIQKWNEWIETNILSNKDIMYPVVSIDKKTGKDIRPEMPINQDEIDALVKSRKQEIIDWVESERLREKKYFDWEKAGMQSQMNMENLVKALTPKVKATAKVE